MNRDMTLKEAVRIYKDYNSGNSRITFMRYWEACIILNAVKGVLR
jgi:hypothetical protein